MHDRYLIELSKQQSRFENWLVKQKLSSISPIKQGEIDVKLLIELCLKERKDNCSLHAVWLLEKLIRAYPKTLAYVAPQIIFNLHQISIEGSQRIFGNIFIMLLQRQDIYSLSIDEEETIIEMFFSWMIAPQKAVAVVANCFEVLSYLCGKHPWIKDELAAQIEYFMKEGPASIQARGKRILTQLKTIS